MITDVRQPSSMLWNFLSEVIKLKKVQVLTEFTMYSRPSYQAPTEEAFVLSSLKEFVKLWGSGSQANLQLECNEGKACIRFSAQIGSPADLHFVPHIPRHGVHGEECPLP